MFHISLATYPRFILLLVLPLSPPHSVRATAAEATTEANERCAMEVEAILAGLIPSWSSVSAWSDAQGLLVLLPSLCRVVIEYIISFFFLGRSSFVLFGVFGCRRIRASGKDRPRRPSIRRLTSPLPMQRSADPPPLLRLLYPRAFSW